METIARPDRWPDFITPWGGCFWWPELVFVNRDSEIFSIRIDQEDGSLRSYDRDGRAGYFPSHIKANYDNWLYETFESKFMGNSSDEDTVTKS